MLKNKRLVATVCGTAACALAIGNFMQQSAPAAAERGLSSTISVQMSVLAPSGASDVDDYAMLEIQDITLTSAQPDFPAPQQLAKPQVPGILVASTNGDILPDAPAEPELPRLGCDVTATAQAADMASVDLSVSAPCYGNQRLTIHHSGMMFTDVTDEQGSLSVSVPALSESAVFIVAFANGKGTVATTKVPDLGSYDRVALQWAGDSGFQVHAREFGAAYGDQGHVWAGSENTTAQHSSGHVVRLGNTDTLAPQMVEVYSFPSGSTELAGKVALTVETEVTAANCGRDVSAQAMELSDNRALRTRDLVLSVPNCTAIGDFLVLNNLFDDLKIAAN